MQSPQPNLPNMDSTGLNKPPTDLAANTSNAKQHKQNKNTTPRRHTTNEIMSTYLKTVRIWRQLHTSVCDNTLIHNRLGWVKAHSGTEGVRAGLVGAIEAIRTWASTTLALLRLLDVRDRGILNTI
jgi:hypothetical protein